MIPNVIYLQWFDKDGEPRRRGDMVRGSHQ